MKERDELDAARAMEADCRRGERAVKLVDSQEKRSPSSNRNSYRWDEIGGYVVSTIRLPEPFEATGARYETLVYSLSDGEWDVDGSGMQSDSEVEADAAHVAACNRIRGRIQ